MIYANNKRYYTYDAFLKEKFGSKTIKIPLDGGFSCPNIDGTRGRGGCTYCTKEALPYRGRPISEQFELGREPLIKKWGREGIKEQFIPYFQEVYNAISGAKEQVSLAYVSQLHDRDLTEAFARTRSRDLILGWTSQGVHKDELEMKLGDYPLKRVGSQGQQKSYLLAMKLGQALFLNSVHAVNQKPILLLDDIFDKLDSERVERIVQLVAGEPFGQIFITDTDRQHLTALLTAHSEHAKVFEVNNGNIHEIN